MAKRDTELGLPEDGPDGNGGDSSKQNRHNKTKSTSREFCSCFFLGSCAPTEDRIILARRAAALEATDDHGATGRGRRKARKHLVPRSPACGRATKGNGRGAAHVVPEMNTAIHYKCVEHCSTNKKYRSRSRRSAYEMASFRSGSSPAGSYSCPLSTCSARAAPAGKPFQLARPAGYT